MKMYFKLISALAIVFGAANLQAKALVIGEDTKSTVTIPLFCLASLEKDFI